MSAVRFDHDPQHDVADEPADPGASVICCLVCAALACIGAIAVTGNTLVWGGAAGALLAVGYLVSIFWPTPEA
ncbi:hypothetical protein ACFFGH_06445 [Lysobacter korlensis]|uniref:Uncharacterized protein n=1 Tax=Lysobacter korlensis TaxID=553636 RepID=A0ABV6RNM3_9GAMM